MNTLRSIFDLDKKQAELDRLNAERESPNFWSNMDRAKSINRQIKEIQKLFAKVESIKSKIGDLIVMKELCDEGREPAIVDETYEEIIALDKELDALKIRTLLNEKYDDFNAIVTIHAGAGGTEAQDWVDMLYRMYTMYCNKADYDVTVVDRVEGNDAGTKSITFIGSGENAYGKLKCEKGVHRLVRISPFDSEARRHTSFASVDVIPEVNDECNIKLNPDELKIDTYRSGGAGGQHINKTESAIRITHLPTGIVVTCQNERSQIQNKEMAIKILSAKLLALEEEKRAKEIKQIQGSLKKIEWGSQIRSYVFQPYTMVKDHRTDYETSDVQGVMNGDIEPFIDEYLKALKS